MRGEWVSISNLGNNDDDDNLLPCCKHERGAVLGNDDNVGRHYPLPRCKHKWILFWATTTANATPILTANVSGGCPSALGDNDDLR